MTEPTNVAEADPATRPRVATAGGLQPARRTKPKHVLGDSRTERFIVVFIGLAMLALGVIGGYVSFGTVSAYMRPGFHQNSWTIPIGIDLAILVFSAGDLLLAYWNNPVPAVQLVPWGFTAATIYFNWQGDGTLPIKIAHAMMPSLWIVFCFYARHVILLRVGLVDGTRMEKIPLLRWIMFPVSSFRLRRRMVSWQIKSFSVALELEADRLTRIALLEMEHGKRWAKKATAMQLLPLQLGALAPASTLSKLRATGALDASMRAVAVAAEEAETSSVIGPARADAFSGSTVSESDGPTASDQTVGPGADTLGQGRADVAGRVGSSRADQPASGRSYEPETDRADAVVNGPTASTLGDLADEDDEQPAKGAKRSAFVDATKARIRAGDLRVWGSDPERNAFVADLNQSLPPALQLNDRTARRYGFEFARDNPAPVEPGPNSGQQAGPFLPHQLGPQADLISTEG